MPYASCLDSCSVVLKCSLSWCMFSLRELCLSCCSLLNAAQLVLRIWAFCSLFYLGHIHIALWESLSGPVHSGIVCLVSQVLWLGSCILGWPVWPVIGYPLLGVHPSMSIVRLIMIGYHCNHLDGQLNYQASAHWLIGGTTMYPLCNQWFCHSTHKLIQVQTSAGGDWHSV